ncbi:MAG: amidohydrolase family protein [Bacteroidetes bacterium]|nr:amidohydrolase family protein [Bacteroidota bacterium]
MKTLLLSGLGLLLALQLANAQVIDVHLHSYTNEDYLKIGGKPHMNIESPLNGDQHLKETIQQMDKNKIEYAVISGWDFKSVQKYVHADSRFIPGYMLDEDPMTVVEFEQLIKDGKIKVFGEIGAQYYGKTLIDSSYASFLRVCEKYDIPVGVHTGAGPPMQPYKRCCPNFRISLGDPYLIEDVLVKYPKLRVYMMHGGEVHFEHAIRMMTMYTNLYIDISALLWVEPFVLDYGVRLLKLAKQHQVLDRVMFGSDQMAWPGAISRSIEFLNMQSFLSDKEKRMILYDNAKTFLKLM